MTIIQQRAEQLDPSTFFGVPIIEFENGGRQQLILLLMSGLEPASKAQIGTMLDNFLRDSTADAVFLTSILPAGWRGGDYRGESWFGTSHQSDVPGCIRHSLRWIRRECRRRGLYVRRLGRERAGQTWLHIVTSLNGTKLDTGVPAEIHAGDALRFGDVELRFQP
jgi:hypothetical protein